METTLRKIRETYDACDHEMLFKAYDYAKMAHVNQKRASGEPYFIHPCAVAEILMDLGLDTATVAAAFLHDVIEDTDTTEADICREFGCDEAWLRTGEGEPFRQQGREEQIMRFAVQTVKGSDEFRKSFVSMLAKLEPEDWENLSKIYRKLQDEYKKD